MKTNISNDDHVLNENSDIADCIVFPSHQQNEENCVDEPKLEKESKQITNMINDEALFWIGSERAKLILKAASKSQSLSSPNNNHSIITMQNKNISKKSESGLDNFASFSYSNSPTNYKKRKASFQNTFSISPISSSLYSRGSTFLKALQDQKNLKSTHTLSSNNIDKCTIKTSKDLAEVSLTLNQDNTFLPLVPILKSISTDSSKKKKVLFTDPVVSNKLYFDSSSSTLKGSTNTELINEQSEEKVKRKKLDISVIGPELEIEEIKCDDNETPIKRSRTLLNEDGKANVETCFRKIKPSFRNIFDSPMESNNDTSSKLDNEAYDSNKVEMIDEKNVEITKINSFSNNNQISKNLIENSLIIDDISTNISKSFQLTKPISNENHSLISTLKNASNDSDIESVELSPDLVNLTEIKSQSAELTESSVDFEISQSDINISHENVKQIINITTNFSPIKCLNCHSDNNNELDNLKCRDIKAFKADIDNQQQNHKLLQMNTSEKDDSIKLNLAPQKSILRSNSSK